MKPRRLRELGEDRLLEQLLRRLATNREVINGAGDDCALVKSPGRNQLTVLKTDCVVEKVHFESAADPIWIGWKALMRPLSDFAAVSALPQFALVTLIVSGERTQSWVKKIYLGLNRAARRFDVAIVGGETSRTPGPATISVSVTGLVERSRWVSRAGGKVGDDVFVSGKLGGSRAEKHLRFVPRIEESRWLTKNFSIHAMMDLSDGLGADLPRLARASRVGFSIDESSLPRSPGASVKGAISDGEDYELLFSISSRSRNRLEKAWRKRFPRVPLTRIGRLNAKSKIRNPKLRGGYVHFQ